MAKEVLIIKAHPIVVQVMKTKLKDVIETEEWLLQTHSIPMGGVAEIETMILNGD